jgi:hypothetical protein
MRLRSDTSFTSPTKRIYDDFSFEVATPRFVYQRNVVAGSQKLVRSTLVHQRIMPKAFGQRRAPRLADQFDMIHIGRAIRPLICTRQGGCGIMFVETFARYDGMFEISRQRLQTRRNLVPVVKCSLQCRRDVRGIGIPSEIIRYDNKMPVTARFQRS